MMNFGERLRFARKMRNWSQEELASASGVTQATVSKIERGDQEASIHTPALADALNIRTIWLASEQGSMAKEGVADAAAEYDAYPKTKPVAIINWMEALELPPIKIDPQGRPAFTWRHCGDRPFALRMKGHSMEPSTPQKLYAPDGCLLICNPDTGSSSTDWAIIHPQGYSEPVCRKIVREGGKLRFIPLNPQYSTIDGIENCRIIAHVVDIDLMPEN